jgi:hypothetical protein
MEHVPGLPLNSSGISPSTTGETLETSTGSETLESCSASTDSVSTSSLSGVRMGPDFAKPRKSTSYFITALPSNSIPYCSPAASIEESYPFESSRLLPRISADSMLEPADNSTLGECVSCSTEGITNTRFRNFTRHNTCLSRLAPLVAPCIFTSTRTKKFSMFEHKCKSCGASFTAHGSVSAFGKQMGTEERGCNVTGPQSRPSTRCSTSQKHQYLVKPSISVDASIGRVLEVCCVSEESRSQEPPLQISAAPTISQ